mmetsp:Transcript_27509/g.65528  ORF Transcript_27509/g.65528 Transcript_27509/m.65528 type:complete len:943 (+) Transcript_27509:197-3025(+)
MPLRLNIRRKLTSRSDRVKCVDLHPDEPWMLCSLYNGTVHLWNYQSQTLLKTFEVTELPVRAAKFIARKQWIITGSDDLFVRVFNYNTMEKIKGFEAHSDYLRSVAVHPTLPYCVTCSDDMTIKLWDWDNNWECKMTYEGHSHYVMQAVFNPKDPNTFASASLDRSIKVWGLTSPTPHFTLEGHEKGVNCIDYFAGGDKPYLISGADDKTVKLWDYQARTCVQTLSDHTHNVSAVAFHPDLPIILTGSEDGAVRLFHANTFNLENTLNYGMERVWAISCKKGSSRVGLGYDEGSAMIKLGKEQPVASMDQSSGKIIWAKHNEIQMVNVKTAPEGIADGERIPLAIKELGNCEVYPQKLRHDPKGRNAVVCGDGEYIIYTALAWRNKSFGNAIEVVWAANGDYASREGPSKIKLYRDFKEKNSITLGYAADALYGGTMLGVRCAQEFVFFYDWETGTPVRRIDVTVKNVHWSESGTLVALASTDSVFVLKYDKDAVDAYVASGAEEEDGCEGAFEPEYEAAEKVSTGKWIGDCFVYVSSNDRLNYIVGGEVQTLHHLDRRMYLLGYMAKENRLYMIDKEFNIVSYELLLSVLEYKTCVVRGDFATAATILPAIPADHRNKVARFLETQGLKEEALAIATDPDYRFELAIQLKKLEEAYKVVAENASDQKWKQLGDLVIANGDLALAAECLTKANDHAALLLLHSCQGNRKGVEALAVQAADAGKTNVAFLCYFLLGNLEACLTLLSDTNRTPEAAFLARTYAPSSVSKIVALWRKDLTTVNAKAAESLADPAEYPNLFPDFDLGLVAEHAAAEARKTLRPASDFSAVAPSLNDNLIEKARSSGAPSPAKAPAPSPPASPGGGADEAAEEEEARVEAVKAEGRRKEEEAAAKKKADEASKKAAEEAAAAAVRVEASEARAKVEAAEKAAIRAEKIAAKEAEEGK